MNNKDTKEEKRAHSGPGEQFCIIGDLSEHKGGVGV